MTSEVDDTYTAAAPRLRQAAGGATATIDAGAFSPGTRWGGLRERVRVRVALLNPRDLSDRSVPGMDEISAGGPGPDKPRTASTTC